MYYFLFRYNFKKSLKKQESNISDECEFLKMELK